jgi:hypothetical protein
MKNRFYILAGLLALTLCLSGCAKSSDDSDDDDVAAFAGTWTGTLTSTADPAMEMTLPIVIKLDKNGSASLAWHYANDVETYKTDSYKIDGDEVSFKIRDTFDTNLEAPSPTTDTGTLSCKGKLSGDDIITGTYELDYDTAGIASDSGTIAVSNATTSIVGTWKGVWQNGAGYSDVITVVFKSDKSFTVSGGSDYDIDIPGTWYLSDDGFTAESAAGSATDLEDSDTSDFSAGEYSATAKGSCLIGGSYTLHLDPSGITTGDWSLGKVFD